jgi:hypothetical protein
MTRGFSTEHYPYDRLAVQKGVGLDAMVQIALLNLAGPSSRRGALLSGWRRAGGDWWVWAPIRWTFASGRWTGYPDPLEMAPFGPSTKKNFLP